MSKQHFGSFEQVWGKYKTATKKEGWGDAKDSALKRLTRRVAAPAARKSGLSPRATPRQKFDEKWGRQLTYKQSHRHWPRGTVGNTAAGRKLDVDVGMATLPGVKAPGMSSTTAFGEYVKARRKAVGLDGSRPYKAPAWSTRYKASPDKRDRATNMKDEIAALQKGNAGLAARGRKLDGVLQALRR